MKKLLADKAIWRAVPVLFLFVLFAWASSGFAVAARGEKTPAFPTPLGYVSDYAELIDADWQSRIRAVCKELENRTGVEMIVVTIETASPYSHAREYAEGLYREWHIGEAQQERGMLLLASLKERQAVVVLGRSLLSLVGKPKLDELSTQYLIPMYQNARYGESLYRATVGLASASGSAVQAITEPKRSSSAGFWMNVAVALAMLFALWRFTRPERRHPFQRWRRGGYWSTGQGGFGGNFGGFGGSTRGQGLS
ncbi:MAG: TPM domain-containing protein [Nitrospira sp. SB0667_bin_9]|nr:TPM domain-containing protein [Nitrospira sp. SB0667_bin_9]MYD31485.1 TPM domain-containing protein [Nitrospira sp. SB0661_bin_20]MYJ23714.1 TPM domain-containing protein [Nitrospira sp. SB0673_bin_12]